MKAITLLTLTALALPVFAAPAFLNSNLLQEIKDRQEKSDIRISSDTLTGDGKTSWVELGGNVTIGFGLYTLSADKVRLNRETGEVEASGNVKIVSETMGSWQGERIAFNYKTGEGLVSAGIFSLGPFFIHTDNVARRSDGVYTVQDLQLTTCTNEAHAWHWHVKGSGEYKDGEYVLVRNAVPYFFGVPVGWVPWFYRDLKNHYGFRLSPGYTSRWGAYAQGAYIYPLLGSSSSSGELYGKTRLDLRSKRGLGLGQELTWRADRFNTNGRLELYWAHDQDLPDQREYRNWMSTLHEDRYRIALYNRMDFTPRDSFRIHGEYVSDSEFRTDFLERYARRYSQPLNYAAYEHREHGWIAGLNASGPLNSFYSGVRRLPEAWVNLMPTTFGIKDLYYDAEIRLGWLDRQPAKYTNAAPEFFHNPGPWADYDTGRLDFRQTLRRPFRLLDGVTLTPRIGWRGTYYTDSDSPRDSLFRSYFEFGAHLTAQFYADYGTYRHTVRPYVDWAYIPRVTGLTEGDNYAFDRVDAAYEWRDQFGQDGLYPPHQYHGVRFGVRNLLQDRSKAVPRTLFDWDAYAAYVMKNGEENWLYSGRNPEPLDEIQRTKRETGWRLLGMRGQINLTDRLTLNGTFEYDPEESAVALFDVHTRLNLKDFTLYAGYLSRDHDVSDYRWREHIEDIVAYGGFVHRISDTWGWSLYTRYNLDRNDLEEVGGYIQYSLDCLTLRLTSSYMPSYSAADGAKYDSDYRVGLNLWLRALPSRDREDWMTWGGMYKEDEFMD